jgi:hypothetical protein
MRYAPPAAFEHAARQAALRLRRQEFGGRRRGLVRGALGAPRHRALLSNSDRSASALAQRRDGVNPREVCKIDQSNRNERP